MLENSNWIRSVKGPSNPASFPQWVTRCFCEVNSRKERRPSFAGRCTTGCQQPFPQPPQFLACPVLHPLACLLPIPCPGSPPPKSPRPSSPSSYALSGDHPVLGAKWKLVTGQEMVMQVTALRVSQICLTWVQHLLTLALEAEMKYERTGFRRIYYCFWFYRLRINLFFSV